MGQLGTWVVENGTAVYKGGGKWDSWVQGRRKMGQLGTRAVENGTAGYKGSGKWDSWVQTSYGVNHANYKTLFQPSSY